MTHEEVVVEIKVTGRSTTHAQRNSIKDWIEYKLGSDIKLRWKNVVTK